MGKIDEKKLSKRNALMKAAFELFTEKGREHTSVSEISQRAGVAKGTFYLYFADKEDIVRRLIVYHSKKVFVGAISDMEKNTPPQEIEDKLIYITNYIIDFLKNEPNILKFISKNLSWGIFKSALENGGDADALDCRRYFRSMTEGVLTDPHIVLFMITELVSSVCYSSVIEGSPASPDELKPHLFAALRGIIEKFKVKKE